MIDIRAAVIGLVMAATAAGGADAQSRYEHASMPNAAAVPFGPGEDARYQVRLGFVGNVGEGRLFIDSIVDVRGKPSYHIGMRLKGGIPFARVDTKYDSWLDIASLSSRRFHQDQKEVRYERKRTFDFFPEQRLWRQDNGESGPLPTANPLDDLSFLFYARTLPLEVGETYTLNRYFQEDGNPVTLQVLRMDTVRVPAGVFETIVVRPIIKSKGLFSEGGEAEVHFTNDTRRVLVMLTSKVKVLKSLDLLLQSYTPGVTVSTRPFPPVDGA